MANINIMYNKTLETKINSTN